MPDYSPERLTDKIVRELVPPAEGNKLKRDGRVPGFAVRVVSSGGRQFVFNYRRKSDGKERRKTIGAFPAWSVAAAREEAVELRRRVDRGGDPLGEQEAE